MTDLKYLGMIMIISVFSYLGLMITNHKRLRIYYLENVIYIADRIKILLSSTVPSTQAIMNELSSDERLNGFELERGKSFLNDKDYQKIQGLINSVGMYDIDSQIEILSEFSQYFDMIKNQYKDDYSRSYKIYILGGISIGILISILLI